MAAAVIVLVVLAAGCTGKGDVASFDAARKVLEKYERAKVEVDDYRQVGDADMAQLLERYEQCRPLMTEQGYQRFMANRLGGVSLTFAAQHECTIRLASLRIDKQEREGDRLVLDYTADIDLGFKDGSHKVVAKKGQASMIKEGGTWKILNDRRGHVGPEDFR